MDPLSAIGAAASIAQLAGLAKTIIIDIWEYCDAVHNAPKRSLELRQEIMYISTCLKSLEHVSMDLLFTNEAPLDEFKQILKDIWVRVTAAKTKGIGRWIWPFTQDENDRLLSRLGSYKTTFTFALSIKIQ